MLLVLCSGYGSNYLDIRNSDIRWQNFKALNYFSPGESNHGRHNILRCLHSAPATESNGHFRGHGVVCASDCDGSCEPGLPRRHGQRQSRCPVSGFHHPAICRPPKRRNCLGRSQPAGRSDHGRFQRISENRHDGLDYSL